MAKIKPQSMSPAFQFYPADFLSDVNVVMMNNRQLGCYIRLICYCWREGSIPNDLTKLAMLCHEEHEWLCHNWGSIAPCFDTTDDAAQLVHPRLERERIKQQTYRNIKSQAGKRGATKRWDGISKGWQSHASAIGLPLAENGKAIVSPMAKNSSSSSSSTSVLEPPISPKGDSEPTGFAEFWRTWPRHHRKIAKSKCLAHWTRHGLEGIASRVVAALKRSIASPDWTKDGGEFIPMPMSWLNKSPWETEDADVVAPKSNGDLAECGPVSMDELRRRLGVQS